MKKTVFTTLLLLLYIIGINAQDTQTAFDGQVEVRGLNVARNEGNLFVSMDFGLERLRLKTSRELLLAPMLVTDTDTLRLPGIVVAGRNRYYHRLRQASAEEALSLYQSGKTDAVHYQTSVPYADWMETAELTLAEDLCGCRSTPLLNSAGLLAALDFTPEVFEAEYSYQPPKAEVMKIREVRGSAYIDFPVNRTELYPDYRRNPAELDSIRRSIDHVKNDPDVRITSVSIKGYASPEGSYKNNIRLAKGRTKTLMHYVQNLYHFPDSTMHTDFEPEDWAGLRRLVTASNLADKEGILALIDSDREPDNKNWAIQKNFPEQYRFMLQEWYPALRHSDYCVEYVVRAYTDVEEIKRLLYTAPQKLSLQEFYRAAESMEPGSDEFNDVFETAVRMFPSDPVANLNAANAAMGRNDLKNARKYLAKAGDTPKAIFARGVLEAKEQHYDEAEKYFRQAAALNVEGAEEALQQLDALRKKQALNGK